MHIASIEGEVGRLPLAKELIASRRTREETLAAPPQPEQPRVDATGLSADLEGLADAHLLSEERVAALVADPLA